MSAASALAPSSRERRPLFAMLAADAVSITGNMLTLVAVPWFVLQTTGSAAKTGLTAFFTTLPVILSASLGGRSWSAWGTGGPASCPISRAV